MRGANALALIPKPGEAGDEAMIFAEALRKSDGWTGTALRSVIEYHARARSKATVVWWTPAARLPKCVHATDAGQPEITRWRDTRRDMATATQLGQSGLQGWREKVADGISQPVAKRAPLDEDQVRAAVGAAFFVLAVIYVIKTISEATRQARQG